MTSDGGPDAERLRYGGDYIEIETRTAGDTPNLVVRDDGPGIPIVNADHPDDGQPGAIGIGLTVSHALARLMNGDLVYRHTGDMPEFALTLPTAPEEERTSSSVPGPSFRQGG